MAMTEAAEGRGIALIGRTPVRQFGMQGLRPVERVFAMTAFPSVLTLAFYGAWRSIRSGVDPALAIALPIGFAYLFLAVAERLLPWHESWLHSKGDLRTDIGLYFTNTLVSVLGTPLVVAAFAYLGALLSGQIGIGYWPVDWPILAQVALALVIAEFIEYWFHRLMHEVPFLWRFHATHHSSPRLYWLNAVRFHPIDLFSVGVLKLAPLAVLGAGAEVFALVNLYSAIHGIFQHGNVPTRLGPLNWIFSMAELHRWHHSKTVEEANHNYGGNLIFWDIVFGTRFLPADREPSEEIGIAELPDFPMGYWANLASPFRWRAVREASRRD